MSTTNKTLSVEPLSPQSEPLSEEDEFLDYYRRLDLQRESVEIRQRLAALGGNNMSKMRVAGDISHTKGDVMVVRGSARYAALLAERPLLTTFRYYADEDGNDVKAVTKSGMSGLTPSVGVDGGNPIYDTKRCQKGIFYRNYAAERKRNKDGQSKFAPEY
eukprot:Selendium_serpulae@DN4173_c1_g1_i1.p1